MVRAKNSVTDRYLMAYRKKDKKANASRPAEARTSSREMLYRTGIQPKKDLGRSGSLAADCDCFFLALYSCVHLGRRMQNATKALRPKVSETTSCTPRNR